MSNGMSVSETIVDAIDDVLDAAADAAKSSLDRLGDRIEERFDAAGDAAKEIVNSLTGDSVGTRIDRILDNEGKSINDLLDRLGEGIEKTAEDLSDAISDLVLGNNDGSNSTGNSFLESGNIDESVAALGFVSDVFESTLGVVADSVEDSLPISDALDDVISVIIKAAEELEGIPYSQENSFNIIDGTASNDLLTGTSGKDHIRGFDGNDVIRGLGSDDLLFGGKGRDIFTYEEPEDIILQSSDTLEDVANATQIIATTTALGAWIVRGAVAGTAISPGLGTLLGGVAGAIVGEVIVIGALLIDRSRNQPGNNAPNNAPNNTSQFSADLNFVSDVFESTLGTEAVDVEDSLAISDALDDVISVLTKAAEELDGIGDSRDFLNGGDCTSALASNDIVSTTPSLAEATQFVTNLFEPRAVGTAIGAAIAAAVGRPVAGAVHTLAREIGEAIGEIVASSVESSLPISDAVDDVVWVLTKTAEELKDIGDIRELLNGGDCTNGGEIFASNDATQFATSLFEIIAASTAIGAALDAVVRELIPGATGGIVADDAEGFGRDVIKDFEKGFDQIQLNFSDLTFDTLNLSVVGNNTVIDLSSAFGNPLNSDTITVVGVTNLESSDFSFLG